MKKKIFTLLTLLTCAVTGVWADVYETYTVSLNNEATQTPSDANFFSVAGSYNNKYKDATYAGVSYTKGLKLDSSGKVSFTTTVKSDVTYVQSTSSNGTNTTKFGNQTVSQTSGSITLSGTSVNYTATTGTNYIEYVFTDVPAGTYTIAKGSGECGLLYAKVELTEEPIIVAYEINSASLNGSELSAEQIATLKSTKALTIDGSSFNGVGALNVNVSVGMVTPTKNIVGNNAVYTFTYDSQNYTITVENIVKTYTLKGFPVYYAKDGSAITDSKQTTVTANGITFTYPSKTFQYGSSNVEISGTTYQPLKLSTGEGVTVSFPTGFVVTKIIVYGWSSDGTGYMKTFKEGESGENSINTTSNLFYAIDGANSNQPSVYEYDVDNWETLYFECAGGQPFVVIDFVLAQKVTISDSGLSTLSCSKALDLSNLPDGLKAYMVSAADASKVTLEEVTEAVAANTGLILEGTASTTYSIPVATTAGTDISSSNLLVAGDGTTTVSDACVLKDGEFHPVNSGVIAANKAYLPYSNITGGNPFADGARGLAIVFSDGNTTAVKAVETLKNDGAVFNLAGQRIAQPTKGLYIVNGKKVIVK